MASASGDWRTAPRLTANLRWRSTASWSRWSSSGARRKPLTITGLTLNPAITKLAGIDKTIDWSVVWGERRKAEAAAAKPAPAGNGGFDSNGSGYSIDEIEGFVREGAPMRDGKSSRSEIFHTVVGHYHGCGWSAERIFAHLQQFPTGIGDKYIAEGRLSGEIARSLKKYEANGLPTSSVNGWTNGFEVKSPAPDTIEHDAELDDDAGDIEPE